MAPLEEEICSAEVFLDVAVMPLAEEGDPRAQGRVALDAASHPSEERSIAEAHVQMQVRKPRRGGRDRVEHHQWVLVVVQVPQPEQTRIPGETGRPSGLEVITGRKGRRYLHDLEHRQISVEEAQLLERCGLLAGGKHHGVEGAEPPPGVRAAPALGDWRRMVLGDDQAIWQEGPHAPQLTGKDQTAEVYDLRVQLLEPRQQAARQRTKPLAKERERSLRFPQKFALDSIDRSSIIGPGRLKNVQANVAALGGDRLGPPKISPERGDQLAWRALQGIEVDANGDDLQGAPITHPHGFPRNKGSKNSSQECEWVKGGLLRRTVGKPAIFRPVIDGPLVSVAGSLVRARPVERGDVPAVVELFSDVFDRHMTAEHYRWKLFERPSPTDNTVIAANDRGRPVFHLGGIPCRCSIAGVERWVMVAVDAMTRREQRRQGLFTTCASWLFERWRQAGVALVLGMPNERHGSRVQALGWRPLGSLEWLLFPLQPESLLARRLGIPGLSRLRVGGRWWYAVTANRGAVDGDIVVSEISAPGDEFDRFWQRIAPQGGNGLVRDRAWLTWRYCRIPGRCYRLLKAARGTSGGAMLGYLVCGVRDPRALTIPELVVAPGDATTFSALIRAALREYAGDADSVRMLAVPGSWAHGRLRRAGFLRMRHQFRVQVIQLDPDVLPPDLSTAGDWNLMGGDFDVV